MTSSARCATAPGLPKQRPFDTRAAAPRPLLAVRTWISRISAVLAGLLLLGMLVAAVVQVVGRNTEYGSLAWTEEAARYAMTSMVFLALPAVTARAGNITIDFIHETWPGKPLPRLIQVVATIAELAFLVVLSWVTLVSMQVMAGSGQVTPTIGIPVVWLRVPMLVGLVLAAVVVAITLVETWVTRGRAAPDPVTDIETWSAL